MKPTQILWEGAGRPISKRGKIIESNAPCAVCGGYSDRMVAMESALPKSSFSGQDTIVVPTSSAVCEACCWSMEGKPSTSLRMWSILYREDGKTEPSDEKAPPAGPNATLRNKSDMRPMLDALLDPPSGWWFCSLADSGKIHVVIYAKPNYGAGRWVIRFEREDIASTPEKFGKIVHHISTLMAAGYSKTEINKREPQFKKIRQTGMDFWRSHIKELGPGKNGAVERLATFLLREKTADEYRDRTAHCA